MSPILDSLEHKAEVLPDDHAHALYSQLRGLGDLWLNSRTRDAAFRVSHPRRSYPERQPRLLQEPGCCCVFYEADGTWGKRTFRGLVLPVQWVAVGLGLKSHDERLPFGLRDVANEVRRHVPGNEGFVLQFQAGKFPDLSDLDHRLWHESAAASLAVGLISAIRGIQPSNAVHCSAAVGRDGALTAITGLENKLSIFSQGGLPLHRFFVVAANKDNAVAVCEIHNISDGTERIGVFHSVSTGAKLEQQLGPMLVESAIPPDLESKFTDRVRYYEFVSGFDRKKAARYFCSHMAQEIAFCCRKIHDPAECQNATLVSIATDRSEGIHVAYHYLSPGRVAVLYSQEGTDGDEVDRRFRNTALETVHELKGIAPDSRKKSGIESHSVSLSFEDLESLGQSFKEVLDSLRAEGRPLVIDIDRGTTLQKIAILKHAVKPGDFLVSFYHRLKVVTNEQLTIDAQSFRPFLWKQEEFQGVQS